MEPSKPVADFRVLCRDMVVLMAMTAAAPLTLQTILIYWVHELNMVALLTVGPSLLMKFVCVKARHPKSLCVISIPVSST